MSVPALNKVSAPYLPNSVVSALEGIDHPDVAWQPPAKLPPENDLRVALATLTGRMRPLDDTTLVACIAKMIALFEPGTKLGGQETKMRVAAWRDACGDIPSDLFQLATEKCCAGCKFMPRPVELREAVASQLERRATAMARIKQMMAAPGERPFKAEPFPVRLRAMRDSWKKNGNAAKAAQYERSLAKHENREPEAWAMAVIPTIQPTTEERPPFKPLQTPSAKRCAELARSFRTGEPPAEHRDIPEVA